jgi:hypothetical protein
VHSEHAKRVIMFSVEKPVDIVWGYCGVHVYFFGRAELFGIHAEQRFVSQLAMWTILIELRAEDNPFPSRAEAPLRPFSPFAGWSPATMKTHLPVPAGLVRNHELKRRSLLV